MTQRTLGPREVGERVEKLRRRQQELGYADHEAMERLREDLELVLPQLDFSTKEGGAVVYTDRQRYGPDAQLHAEMTGKQTIEMTAGGRWLEDLRLYDGVLYRQDADAIWHDASKRFCESASGEVTYCGPERPGERSTFNQIERPALQSNEKVPRVTRVETLDRGYAEYDFDLAEVTPRQRYEEYEAAFKKPSSRL